MGISGGIRRVAGPAVAVVNTKLEALFRHITNEADHTRASLGRRIDALDEQAQRTNDRWDEAVGPGLSTVAEASTLLQHAALRLERRLAELSTAVGGDGPPTPPALVVLPSSGLLTDGDVGRLVAGANWLGPAGRLVVVAPVETDVASASLEQAVSGLATAGWTVVQRSGASVVEGAWVVGSSAEAANSDLVLVELARAPAPG